MSPVQPLLTQTVTDDDDIKASGMAKMPALTTPKPLDFGIVNVKTRFFLYLNAIKHWINHSLNSLPNSSTIQLYTKLILNGTN